MTLTTVAAPPRSTAPPAHWPLSVLVLGFPVWWLLGLSETMPVLLAVPLALRLARRRDLSLPPGLGWWLLFLAWVCLGLLVLAVDAPGAVTDDVTAGRYLVFGYRLAWYAALTVWLLWIVDTSRERLPDRTVHRLLGYLLVVTVAGGLAGVLAPGVELRSVIELALPEALRSNDFVASLIHPQLADVQTFLGRPEARPKAPFAYTNTWGSALSFTLLFALAAFARAGRRGRIGWLAVLLVAPVPIVMSLNRGLWASLVLGAVGLVVLLAARGRGRVVAGVLAALLVAGALLVASPLGDLAAERFDNQHSNDRRGDLLVATVESVTHGSPVVGFGGTRDVEGNFGSISGGATPECPDCAVPPLGTQGQAWLLIFAQGWVGATLFAAFALGWLRRSVRCRTLNETLCTFALAFLALQVLVYDVLGLPLLLVFLAIGLVAREQGATAPTPGREPTARRLVRRVRPVLVPGTALVLGGALAGAVAGALLSTPTWSATTTVLLSPPPDTPAPSDSRAGPGGTGGGELPLTVDTEAALMRAAPRQLIGAGALAPTTPVTVTAEPNTRAILVHVSGPGPEQVEAAGTNTVLAWFQLRRQQLAQDRVLATERLEAVASALREVDDLPPTGGAQRDSTAATDRFVGTAMADVTSAPVEPGEVVTTEPAARDPLALAVPATSGAGVGLLLAALLVRRRPDRPHRPSRARQGARDQEPSR